MKNAAKLIVLLTLCFTIISCKSEAEKKVEIVTNNYVRFVDSVTSRNKADAKANWNKIEKAFEKKTIELNFKMDNLEDSKNLGVKMDSATKKYKSFKQALFGFAIESDTSLFIE
ncbi:hypothetical protein KBJ98_05860 [Flavobacterium sp. F-328]|uniref:Uncharacterized protein n=1 Tax=Flavobacterium erciyesense TaxID=2825842 RepID=A0ABS5D2H5_9FLAO|nr:hypothetical protein [Flavobacterium erciyesense]MBQ0908223.1 hypothetical protein [Flavobacterium erciyesense]